MEFCIEMFNLAPVKGYEDDVGTKTNFTTVNQSILSKGEDPLVGKESIAAFDALQRQFQGSLLWVPAFSQRGYYEFVQRIVNVSLASGIMKPVVQNPGHFIGMMRLWRALHRRSDWPSTGLYIVSAAFELCEEIDVFGFWFYETSLEGVPAPYHYHNDIIFGTRHSRFKEFQDLVNFHEMGILKMHFGSCKS
ncbi:alpha-N-acetylneuraminide alpha-2,8-sialyltransferase-like [Patiria miniata]|uniref:Uncharacterized protein n=1 Tax=Patiria miniata TaxID=46514 RepID=A0A914AE10_PATMI|nr:alpha-N-acetylneuraminide alpha-2,8-sialyltransferase-like [Patiria miniata]